MAMRIGELWQYPVKSMIGQRVGHARLTPTGIAGDRTWAVRDEVRGGIRGAKKLGQLMQFEARYSADPDASVTNTGPGDVQINSNDPDRDQALSAALDHRVTLWPLQPADDLDHYRRGAPDSTDLMTELRTVFDRDEGEPIPDLASFPPELREFESPPGTYLDAYPVMVMTSSALAALRIAVPDSAPAVRRFRPSMVVDTGERPGHPEFQWVGRTLNMGSAELEVIGPCPRCVMVTREIDAGTPADRAILRHIVAELNQNLGVYARVTKPGGAAVGDVITVS